MMRTTKCLGLALLAFLAGCKSYEDFSGPSTRLDTRDLLERQESSREQADEMSGRLAEALKEWQGRADAAREAYTVGPADHLRVSVFLPSKETSGASLTAIVRDDGRIALPLVGSVPVAGLTLQEIEARLTEAYSNGYYRDPTVSVAVSEYNSKALLVTGSVHRPGPVTLRSNHASVMEALARAGGLSETAGRTLRLTRRSPATGDVESISIDLDALIERPELQTEMLLAPGDVLHVGYAAERARHRFYVMGFVRSPGAYEFPEDGGELTMMDAIAYAKGLGPAARAENTYLVRRTGETPETFEVDLTEVAEAKIPDIRIQPNDTIIVGTTWARRTMDGFLRMLGLRGLAPAL